MKNLLHLWINYKASLSYIPFSYVLDSGNPHQVTAWDVYSDQYSDFLTEVYRDFYTETHNKN